ncbi:hypothetical protein AtDm6_2546 [Acetobacter tropicalis]|uniref:Uncharacterized protein n=1 Tax=Acetobacter tropicalis TaxID=104102 RepID=A0A095AZJ7_9PROT|nr:hypothetical protein AtDm6_2546 [Acetobacter tropicalis]
MGGGTEGQLADGAVRKAVIHLTDAYNSYTVIVVIYATLGEC